MVVLVSDTSILISLERGGLLEVAFACGLTMVVPDLLYLNELESTNGAYLQKLGLGVIALSSKEVATAQKIKNQRSTLSLPDCFALVCAMRPNHALVSGDKALRSEAKKHLNDVFGIFWILDQMAASGEVDAPLLYDGLTAIANDPYCRLPKEEINIRLKAWSPA